MADAGHSVFLLVYLVRYFLFGISHLVLSICYLFSFDGVGTTLLAYAVIKGEDIQERLTGLAISALNVCKEIPRSPMGIHVSGQLIRSATSPASNYAEARVSESRRDFVHKLGIVLKELNESRMWFRIVAETGLLPQATLRGVQAECDELCKIVYTSRRTAASRLPRPERYRRPS